MTLLQFFMKAWRIEKVEAINSMLIQVEVIQF